MKNLTELQDRINDLWAGEIPYVSENILIAPVGPLVIPGGFLTISSSTHVKCRPDEILTNLCEFLTGEGTEGGEMLNEIKVTALNSDGSFDLELFYEEVTQYATGFEFPEYLLKLSNCRFCFLDRSGKKTYCKYDDEITWKDCEAKDFEVVVTFEEYDGPAL